MRFICEFKNPDGINDSVRVCIRESLNGERYLCFLSDGRNCIASCWQNTNHLSQCLPMPWMRHAASLAKVRSVRLRDPERRRYSRDREIIQQQPDAILVLDGINNPGFSGGPVLYNTGPSQVVIGVISGYHSEPGEVHSIEVPDSSTAVTNPDGQKSGPAKTKKEEVVDLNTGIVLAYMAGVAVDAIRKNPIGRPIETK